MFLIDDILSYPVTGILSLLQELHNAAKREAAGAADALRAELSDLYLRLEAGQITEAEFDTQESVLLDQLDALTPDEDEDDDEDEVEDEADDEDEFEEADDEDEFEEADDEDEFEEDEATVEEEVALEQDAEVEEYQT